MGKRKVGNGEGSYYTNKRTGLWEYAYYYNGKRHIMRQRKKELKKEFNKRVNEVKRQIDTESYVEKNGITLGEMYQNIIDNKLKRHIVSESTYRRDNETLKILRRHPVSNASIQKITPVELQKFADSISCYANSVITKIWIMLNAIFKEALKQDLIIKNPMLKVEKPKSEKQDKKVEALTEEEQQAFLDQLKPNEPYRDVFIIALYTGMRMGEILALKVEDVDFVNKEIHMQRTLTKNKEGKTILGETTKTKNGTRIIPITPLFENELRHAISNRVLNINNLIFVQDNGNLWTVSNMNSRFKRICTNAGIGVKPYEIRRFDRAKERTINSKTSTYNQHMLRHTYATRMIEAGVPAEVLQRLLGHKDITTTINTYTSVFNKYKQKHINQYVDYIKRNSL